MKLAMMWLSLVKKHDNFDLETELAAAISHRKEKYPHERTNIAWVNPQHLAKETVIQGVVVKPAKTVPVIHIFLGSGDEL